MRVVPEHRGLKAGFLPVSAEGTFGGFIFFQCEVQHFFGFAYPEILPGTPGRITLVFCDFAWLYALINT